MTTLTEGQHAGEFIVSEGAGTRDAVTVLSGQSLEAGEVCGKVLMALAAAPNPTVTGTGNGTMTVVKPGKLAQVGDYTVTCTAAATDGGTFSVTAPDGTVLPSATVGTAYSSEHLDFLINDGSTDFAVDDVFTVAITEGGTPAVVGTGNGVMSAISLGRDAKPGTYVAEVTAASTDAGTFEVFDPDGASLGEGTVGTAFTSEQINFTIADGATDFIVGDYFHIPVVRGASYGKVVEWDPTTYDGRQHVAGVLFDTVDASSADTDGVLIARGPAEVNDAELQWSDSRTTAEKAYGKEQLQALGIVAR